MKRFTLEMRAHKILVLVFSLPILGFSQAFNGTFEALQPNGIPSGWSISDPSGAAISTESHLGKRSVKAWVYKNYEAGAWISTSSLADANASQVTGYYKYTGDKNECDKAKVSYLLGAKSETGGIDTLAFGDTELKLSKEFKKFDLSVAAVGSGEPEFMTMRIEPSGHCNIHGASNCCFLYVDDIILAGTTTLPSPAETMPEPTPEIEEAAPAEDQPVIAPEETEDDGEPVENTVAPTENTVAPTENLKTPADNTEVEPEPTEAPAEEESTEPIEEGWDSKEESATDGGL